jgi:hypothetical protein
MTPLPRAVRNGTHMSRNMPVLRCKFSTKELSSSFSNCFSLSLSEQVIAHAFGEIRTISMNVMRESLQHPILVAVGYLQLPQRTGRCRPHGSRSDDAETCTASIRIPGDVCKR